jgi:sialidase-1
VAKVLNKDTFAYSCLTAMPDGTIGCLFDHADWSRIKFARFSLEWLSDGKDDWRP